MLPLRCHAETDGLPATRGVRTAGHVTVQSARDRDTILCVRCRRFGVPIPLFARLTKAPKRMIDWQFGRIDIPTLPDVGPLKGQRHGLLGSYVLLCWRI